jgi:hypothetical protein
MSFGFSLATWITRCIVEARELKVQGRKKPRRRLHGLRQRHGFRAGRRALPARPQDLPAAVAAIREHNPDYMTAATTTPAAPAATQTAQTRTPAVTPSAIEIQE